MTTRDKSEDYSKEELNKSGVSYKDAGVDVEAGYDLVENIKPFVEKTLRPEILSGLGSFAALSKIPTHISNPVLVTCTDGVGTKVEIAKILQNEGFINSFQIIKNGTFPSIKIDLKYDSRKSPVIKKIKRISKPGLRVYVNKNEIPRISGGLGTSIISTSRGVMTGNKAREIGVGGEILCSIL